MTYRAPNLERRAFGRRRSCIHAMLLVPGRPPSPCIIRNYSLSGALLELNECLDPPFNLKLRIDCTGEIVDCELKHARGNRVGVILLGAAVGDVLERALGGKVRKKKPLPTVHEPLPRVSASELRQLVLQVDQS